MDTLKREKASIEVVDPKGNTVLSVTLNGEGVILDGLRTSVHLADLAVGLDRIADSLAGMAILIRDRDDGDAYIVEEHVWPPIPQNEEGAA